MHTPGLVWPSTPSRPGRAAAGAAHELDEDERAALAVPAADADAGVAALARRPVRGPGQIWASAPNRQSIIRKPVSPRAANAAGRSGLTMLPGGVITEIGRK